MNTIPERAPKRRKQPAQPSEYDRATNRWFHGGFTIKLMGSTYYAWSHDWKEGTGRGKELGACTSIEEMKTVIDKYEAKFPGG